MNFIPHVAILTAGLLMTACASASDPAITALGVMPTSGTYGIAEADAGSEPLTAQVAERLERRGLVKGEQPSYLLQAVRSERPAVAGLFVPEANDRQWLRDPQPRRRKSTIVQVTISLTDAKNGREVYQVSAAERRDSKRAPENLSRLVDAALADPPKH